MRRMDKILLYVHDNDCGGGFALFRHAGIGERDKLTAMIIFFGFTAVTLLVIILIIFFP